MKQLTQLPGAQLVQTLNHEQVVQLCQAVYLSSQSVALDSAFFSTEV